MIFVFFKCTARALSVVPVTAGLVQPWHNLFSSGSHDLLCLPVSMARRCSLSLYLIKVVLSFLSVTVVT